MDTEILIVGAGTAGAIAALCCARAGLDTMVIEAGDLSQAGARWSNGVPLAAFADAGVAPPKGEELGADGVPFHMVAGWGGSRTTLQGADLLEVDMPLLTARLQRSARVHGARFRGGVTLERADRGAGVVAHTSEGPVRARVIVDASGMTGAHLLDQPRVDPSDICVASQQTHAVTDMGAALRWFSDRRVAQGEVLCHTGIAGGYSIVNVRLHAHGPDQVSILTGSIPGAGHPSGVALMRAFLADHPWIGPKVSGGSRAIPLCAPLAAVGSGPVAAIGDAARQVFSAHGSGIGPQLRAAPILADVLARGGDGWDYNRAWQQRWGGLLAATATFAQLSRSIDAATLGRLMESGLLAESLARATLAQAPLKPDLSDLGGILRGVRSAPDLVRTLAPTLVRMGAIQTLYQLYPRKPAGLARWTRARSRLIGTH